jgi:hypothetical protein
LSENQPHWSIITGFNEPGQLPIGYSTRILIGFAE